MKTEFEKYLESGYSDLCDFRTYQYYRRYTRRNVLIRVIMWFTKIIRK